MSLPRARDTRERFVKNQSSERQAQNSMGEYVSSNQDTIREERIEEINSIDQFPKEEYHHTMRDLNIEQHANANQDIFQFPINTTTNESRIKSIPHAVIP